jgi:GDP-4-dehydro-6-deoxy-D-mannose reductase
VSSGQVYAVAGDQVLTEGSPLGPASPYAASKAMAELLMYQFPPAQHERVITARPFNHSGPRQTSAYSLSDFAHQIAEMEAGLRPPVLKTGDLSLERDFTDVRDVVRAYVMLLDSGRGGQIYNVCSGTAHSLSSACAVFRSLSSVQMTVQVIPEKVRPGQPQRICGDPGKLVAETGWAPAISWEGTLSDLLQYWRERVHQRSESSSFSLS